MGLDIEALDRLEPGAALAEALAQVDSASLSGYDRIVVLKAQQRQVAHYQAQAYGQMAAIVSLFLAEDDDYECAYDSASTEIAAALHLTRRAADYELDTALALSERIPQVGEALWRGEIDLRRARTFRWGTGHLEEEVARQIVAGVIGRAPTMTAGQLDAYLRRQALQHDPEAAKKRYLQAVAERRVVLEATQTGSANLSGFDLPAEQAAQIMARICALADSAKTADDPRTMDQIRADVYLDLLIGNAASKKHGIINLHVDLETLTRLNENPGEWAGYGPVISDLARQVAESQTRGQWRYTIDDPDTGQPLGNGITRRRPTTAQRRQIEARNPTCIHPGCRAPAIRSDIDHHLEYAKGGATRVSNLDPYCAYHHTIRHRARWTRQRLPNGDHLHQSRLGHKYTTSGRSP